MKDFFKIKLDYNRIFGLDLLRPLAILFVVIGHGSYLLPVKLQRLSDFLVFDGVSIFFVLSGFLIGGILIKTLNKNEINGQTLLNFWIRRWFRTLPNYFLILILLCFLNYLFNDDFTLFKVKRYFIFSQNLFTEQSNWFFPEAWSLSVEEWFYLLVPVLILFSILSLQTSPKNGVLVSAIFVIFIITLFRFYRYNTSIIESTNTADFNILFRKPVFTRLDSLMFGVIGAYIQYYYHKSWLRYTNILLIIGIMLFIASKFIIPKHVPINSLYYTVFSFSITSIATLLLLPFLSNLKTGTSTFHKTIMYISLTSYSMYLINLSLIQGWIINRIPWSTIIGNGYILLVTKYALYWILVITLSIILYKYFEVPMTNLRENRRIKKLLMA